MQSEIMDPESLKTIFETENEKISVGKKGTRVVTERLIKIKENDENSRKMFKKQVEFFENVNKEKNLPRLIPCLLDWGQTKTNYTMDFEEVTKPLIDYMEKIRHQKKNMPFSEVLMYAKMILNGFCYLELEGLGTAHILIKDLFLTPKNDLKLLNYCANEKNENHLNFSGILLAFLDLNLELDISKISKEDLAKEIENIEKNYEGNITENESQDFAKIMKFLKKGQCKKADLFKLFTKFIDMQNKTSFKKTILLQDGF